MRTKYYIYEKHDNQEPVLVKTTYQEQIARPMLAGYLINGAIKSIEKEEEGALELHQVIFIVNFF